MFNINNYLNKFSNSIFSAEEKKKQLIQIIKKYTNIDFLKNDIEIKNNIIFLKASPILKNKIFINKKIILENITLTVSNNILDIK